MTTEAYETIHNLALKNDIELGAAYNPLNGDIHQPANVPTEIETKEVGINETLFCLGKDLWELLGLSPEEKLDILTGQTSLNGSFLALEQATNNQDRAFLVYRFIAEKRTVTDYQSENKLTTHFVKSIEYGLNVVLSFSAKAKNTKKLLDFVQKIPTLKNAKEISTLSQSEKSFIKSIACRVYSDKPMEENIATYFDAINFYQNNLLSLGKNDSVPTKFWVEGKSSSKPEGVRMIPEEFITRMLDLLTNLDSFVADCADLENLPVTLTLVIFRQKISNFKAAVEKFRKLIASELSARIHKVKSGSHGHGLLLQILEQTDSSPFQNDSIRMWIDEQKHLCGTMLKMTHRARDYVRICNAKDFQKILSEDAGHDTTLAVHRIGMTEEEYQHLINMKKHLQEHFCVANDETDDETSSLPLFKGSATAMREKLKRLHWLTTENEIKLLIVDEPLSKTEINHHVSLYREGKLILDDFEPPPKTDPPCCAAITHNMIALTWKNVPNIENYVIEWKRWYWKNWEMCEVKDGESSFSLTPMWRGTMHQVRLRANTKLGWTPPSDELVVYTLPSGSPSKPVIYQITPNGGCVITWFSPPDLKEYNSKEHEYRSIYWEILISSKAAENSNPTSTDDSDDSYVHSTDINPINQNSQFIQLEHSKEYVFQVRACYDTIHKKSRSKVKIEGKLSAPSERFTITNIPDEDIVKNKARLKSSLYQHGNPAVYDIEWRSEYCHCEMKCQKVYYGLRVDGVPMKTILVVGATGAGKSTLLNALINYILNVGWDDDFRFRLVRDEISADQSTSQTKWVTAYILYHQKGFQIPFSLTIIDTPGFGDTAGIEADQKIREQLHAFFNSRGYEGIDALDAVCFVVQASQARLTATQRYIFDSILSLFGKDIAENIFIMITFADGQKPPVLDALKKSEMPYTQTFKFNNSALYAQKRPETDSDDDESMFDKMFWTMGNVSYKKFFTELTKTISKSLILTSEVLDERERLEITVMGIQQEIRTGLYKLEELRCGIDCFLNNQSDIDRNKNFTYQVTLQKTHRIEIEQGFYVTNCLNCNRTCHYPCRIPNDENKMKCKSMINRGKSYAKCGVCSMRCAWNEHVNMQYRFEFEEIVETRTAVDLKIKYEEACAAKLSSKEVIEKMLEEIDERELMVAGLTDQVRKSIEQLNAIALKPKHMTTVDYLDILIQSERSEGTPGFQQRVSQLEKVREQAELVDRIAREKGVTEPWEPIMNEIRKTAKEKKGFVSSKVTRIKDFVLNIFK